MKEKKITNILINQKTSIKQSNNQTIKQSNNQSKKIINWIHFISILKKKRNDDNYNIHKN